jgi:hypothetical protein
MSLKESERASAGGASVWEASGLACYAVDGEAAGHSISRFCLAESAGERSMRALQS